MANASSNGGRGNPRQPPPPGGGGDKRKPGRGGGRESNKKRRTAKHKRRGRPLQNMERMTIMGIWYQLSMNARRSLYETLGELLGETPAVASEEASAPAAADNAAPQRRTRVWEREILRDVPLFVEFGQLTMRQRRDDERGIPRLLNIAQGVVSRGREHHVTDREISTAIAEALPSADRLQSLYGGPRDRESDNSSSSRSDPEDNDQQDSGMDE